MFKQMFERHRYVERKNDLIRLTQWNFTNASTSYLLYTFSLNFLSNCAHFDIIFYTVHGIALFQISASQRCRISSENFAIGMIVSIHLNKFQESYWKNQNVWLSRFYRKSYGNIWLQNIIRNSYVGIQQTCNVQIIHITIQTIFIRLHKLVYFTTLKWLTANLNSIDCCL